MANAALMKTFSGDSCHALNELRSYRVPPPLTFGVLQCVLMLCGNDEEDCRNWARMRTLCNQRLIKRLVTLRPGQVGTGARAVPEPSTCLAGGAHRQTGLKV